MDRLCGALWGSVVRTTVPGHLWRIDWTMRIYYSNRHTYLSTNTHTTILTCSCYFRSNWFLCICRCYVRAINSQRSHWLKPSLWRKSRRSKTRSKWCIVWRMKWGPMHSWLILVGGHVIQNKDIKHKTRQYNRTFLTHLFIAAGWLSFLTIPYNLTYWINDWLVLVMNFD